MPDERVCLRQEQHVEEGIPEGRALGWGSGVRASILNLDSGGGC